MKLRRRLILAFGGVAVLALAATWGYRAYRRSAPQTVAVHAGEVKQTIVSSGQVLPPAQIRMESLTSGVVQTLHVREGDRVEPGQTLVELDDDELQAALAQAEAALAQARAGKTGLQRTTLPQATEARNQARVNVQLAQAEYARTKNLFDSGLLAKEYLDQARVQLEVFQSQAEAADVQVKAASSGGTSSVSAAAAISVALAQLEAAKANLKRATILSPIAGVVTERNVEEGESVRPGSALMVLTATGRTRIVLEPDERNLALLKLGQHATVSAEAFPEQSFDAALSFIAPAVNAERGTIEVWLDVPTPPPYLRPNMTVSVELHIESRRNTLAVPLTAIRGLGSAQPWVGVLGKRRNTVRRAIAIGLRGDTQVEVVSGLQPGEPIVLDPPDDAPWPKISAASTQTPDTRAKPNGPVD